MGRPDRLVRARRCRGRAEGTSEVARMALPRTPGYGQGPPGLCAHGTADVGRVRLSARPRPWALLRSIMLSHANVYRA